MASNVSFLKDADGDYSDWIELVNADTVPVNLGNWYLTDSATALTKWRLPSRILAPNSYLLIFASGKAKSQLDIHTNFQLAKGGEFLALVDPLTNIVSQYAPVYPPQEGNVSYGRDRLDPGKVGYLFSPTPGAANTSSGQGFAPEIGFSRTSHLFTHRFSLTLKVVPKNPAAVIRYTLDGTSPTAQSPLYVMPIAVVATTQIRARTFQDGLLPGPVRSEHFVQVTSDLWDFSSDLPILIIHTFDSPFPGKEVFLPAYLEIIEPNGPRTRLTNAPTVTSRIGIQNHGSSTGGLEKHSIRFELRNELDADKDMQLLGLPPESDYLLYAPNQFDPIEIHNSFMYELSRQIGHYAPRTRFVEMYLVVGPGPVSAAHYYGHHLLMETVKIDRNRVDVPALAPFDRVSPEVTGGYLAKIDRSAPGDSSFVGGGQAFQAVNPKGDELRTSQRTPQRNYLRDYLDEFDAALDSVDFADPALGYTPFVDVDAAIDHHLLNELSQNVDMLVLSSFFYKERNGKLVFGPIWDFDRSLESRADGRDDDPRRWFGINRGRWWAKMFRDVNFWQKYIDRYQDLRLDQFSLTNLYALMDVQTETIREVAARDYERWAFIAPRGGLDGEIAIMKNWLSNRVDFIDDQLQSRPMMSSPGGAIEPGLPLTLSMTGPGTIYYTLDGSDPRALGGDVAPGARAYTETIIITNNARVVARVLNPLHVNLTGGAGPIVTTPWSGDVAGTFIVKTPPLVVTEIMYHPHRPAEDSEFDDESFEFVELRNIGEEPLDLGGFRLSGGIRFEFSGGTASTLAAGERVVLVRDLAAFLSRYPNTTDIAGVFDGGLNNNGDRLRLDGPLREPILDFRYDDDWYPITDGFGFSLVIVDDSADLASWGEQSSWRVSGEFAGTPGSEDPQPETLPPVLVNEVSTYQTSPDGDVIELHNPTDTPADIGGWFLTDDLRTPRKFSIPTPTVIPPKGYVVFNEDQFGEGPDETRRFGLSSRGEDVYLFSGNAEGELSGYMHGFEFGPSALNVTIGRHVDSVGREHFVAQVAATVRGANAGPLVGPVVISEIMYHPVEATIGAVPFENVIDEFVELQNLSLGPVPLFDASFPTNTWRLREAVEFIFPRDVILSGGGYAIVVSFDPLDQELANNFRTKYGVAEGVPIFGPYKGKLSDTSESVELYRPRRPEESGGGNGGAVAEVLADRVTYEDNEPWPVTADGLGPSLQRVTSARFGDDPGNWVGALPSVGRPFGGGALPNILVQPKDLTLVAFFDATFSVVPSGTGPFGYQWRFNGENIAGATSATLLLENVQPWQSGQYVVEVLNPAGTVSSLPANLEVLLPATITGQPQTLFLRPGVDATFEVTATSTSPMRYQWRKGTCRQGLDILGATNRVLTVTNVQVANQGLYTLEITDDVGPVCSVPAGLNVLVPAKITEQPLSLTAVQGDDVSFFVAGTASPLPMTFWWRLNGRTLTNVSVDGYNSTYTRPNVQPEDAGRFTVVVGNIASFGVLSQTAVLTVLEDTDGDHLPDVYETERAERGLDPADPGDAILDFDGDGFSNLQEYTAGTDLNDAESFLQVEALEVNAHVADGVIVSFLAVSNRSYTVQFRESHAAGRWTRLADVGIAPTNRMEQIEDPFPRSAARIYRLVTPQQSPPKPGPTIFLSPESQEVLVGTDVELRVMASGLEPLEYQWRYNADQLRGETNATLRLFNVQTNFIGSYWVTIDQLFGSTESERAYLNVLIPPEIRESPASQVVGVGQQLALRVIATGFEPLIYRWYHNDRPLRGVLGPILTLDNVTEADAGVYSVVVKHESPFGPAGVRSEGATVTVVP